MTYCVRLPAFETERLVDPLAPERDGAQALGKLGNIIAETLFPISIFCHDFSVVIPTFPQSFPVSQRFHSLQLHIVIVIDNVCEEISLQDISYIKF